MNGDLAWTCIFMLSGSFYRLEIRPATTGQAM